VHHLLEILFYYASDFDSKKVQEKFGLVWFYWFGGAMAKRAKPYKLLPFYNFASPDTSPTAK
jgi:hypothetical protein